MHRSTSTLALTLLLTAQGGCGARTPRELFDADPDAPSEADVDVLDGDRSQQLVCEGSAPSTFATLVDTTRLTSLDWTAQDHYIVTATTGPAGSTTAQAWVIRDDWLVISQTSLAPARQATASYIWPTALVGAVVEEDQGVSLRRLDFDDRWGLVTADEIELCEGCAVTGARPLVATGWTLAVTEDLSPGARLRLQVIPHHDGEVASSEPQEGTSPSVVAGAHGPIMVYARRDQVVIARHHWDGTLTEELILEEGGSYTSLSARGDGHDLYLALLDVSAEPQITLVVLDAQGRLAGRVSVASPRIADTPVDLSVDETTVALFWFDRSSTGELEITRSVHPRDRPAAQVGPDPIARLGDAEGPLHLSATRTRSGHAVAWSVTTPLGASLSGATVDCALE